MLLSSLPTPATSLLCETQNVEACLDLDLQAWTICTTRCKASTASEHVRMVESLLVKKTRYLKGSVLGVLPKERIWFSSVLQCLPGKGSGAEAQGSRGFRKDLRTPGRAPKNMN